MSKIKINATGDARWDLVATALNGETGVLTGQEIRNGAVFYNANFPLYGGAFLGIPASVATLSE